MNRSYIPENQYTVQNAPIAGETPRAVEAILTFFDLVIAFFAEATVRATLRVLGAILCFFAFLFVIGAVEAATMTFGAGVLTSLLLFAIAFFCIYRPKKESN